MKFDRDFNPGTNNTYQEVNIGHVENYVPNATTVISYGSGERSRTTSPRPKDEVEKANILKTIIGYVNRLSPCIAGKWADRYEDVWTEILGLDIVSESVYDAGKQQGTVFNRDLVANIINYLNSRGFYTDYNSSHFAELLCDKDDYRGKDHPVRKALRYGPSEEIAARLDRFFENYLLFHSK